MFEIGDVIKKIKRGHFFFGHPVYIYLNKLHILAYIFYRLLFYA